MNKDSKKLNRKLIAATFAITITLIVVVGATFAWYIYNTGAHTATMKLAAGSTTNLQISKDSSGPWTSSIDLGDTKKAGEKYHATLVPVSTDCIGNGFQRVATYKPGKEGQAPVVTDLFDKARQTDYYKSRLYLKSSGDTANVYIKSIGGEDQTPIATAIRVGLVVNPDTASQKEFIFELSEEDNPQAQYNTDEGYEGCVLDSTRTDGKVNKNFHPYTKKNWCSYNKSTGEVTITGDSVKICTCEKDAQPVAIDLYIWLEGCDKDCTSSLASMELKEASIEFAGLVESK